MNTEKIESLEETVITEVVPEFIDSATRLKQARALKKEKKKAVKGMTQKFNGDVKMAKKVVKTAVRNIIRRNAGRGR